MLERFMDIHSTLLANPETRAMTAWRARDFVPHLGEAFVIVVPEFGDLTTVLVHVEERVPLQPHREARAPFTLQLRGPAIPVLRQDTYLVRNNRRGDMQVLLAPYRRDADGVLYQIIFG